MTPLHPRIADHLFWLENYSRFAYELPDLDQSGDWDFGEMQQAAIRRRKASLNKQRGKNWRKMQTKGKKMLAGKR